MIIVIYNADCTYVIIYINDLSFQHAFWISWNVLLHVVRSVRVSRSHTIGVKFVIPLNTGHRVQRRNTHISTFLIVRLSVSPCVSAYDNNSHTFSVNFLFLDMHSSKEAKYTYGLWWRSVSKVTKLFTFHEIEIFVG